MAYDLSWASKCPGHLVFLVDLSGSMKKDNKIGQVMDSLQSVLRQLVTSNLAGKTVVPRFTVSIIGYHTDIVSLFNGGADDVKNLVQKAVSTKQPIFDYTEKGIAEPKWQTYMTNAFNAAREDIEKWIAKRGSRLPAPIVINITDGQPEEDNKSLDICAVEALQAAQKLKNVRTQDGNVLLYNIHIGNTNKLKSIEFPTSQPKTTGYEREDKRIKFLFESSSILPDQVIAIAASKDIPAHKGSHGMVSNVADKAELVRLIEFVSTTGAIDLESPKPL